MITTNDNSLNICKGDRIVTVAEGLDIFRLSVPKSLDGTTLVGAAVRGKTGCTVVALRDERGTLMINPPADAVLTRGHEMVLAGSEESEAKFLEQFGD